MTIFNLHCEGIWPESESFNDAQLGPPPAKWKGKCQTSSNFTACNNKIIGARFYHKTSLFYDPEDFKSPRDARGHGTHTSSTAAGNVLKNASLEGLAEGDARGAVPGARIAVYKVCWKDGCSDADVLAAFEDAIHDGVDIISISAGDNDLSDYFENGIAIGAFHAMKNGILTSNSAGNIGPAIGTVSNYSPWSLTVGASTIDRQFISKLVLGNQETFSGAVINTFSMDRPSYPLIYGGDAANASLGIVANEAARNCSLNSLDRNKVKGKIVICDQQFVNGRDEIVYLSGGAGVVIGISQQTNNFLWPSSIPMIPTTVVEDQDEVQIKTYINSTTSPVATILKTEILNQLTVPVAAAFSSRGPNPITLGILKPDITAPGVDILASWSKASAITQYAEDKRFPDFNIISGTSMACPHVSGASAFVKSMNPGWSASAIRSALITTATTMNNMGKPMTNDSDILATPFDFGAGEANPLRALDPGLVYETTSDDYFVFLCNYGLDSNQIKTIAGNESYNCPSGAKTDQISNMNYPTIAISKLDLNGNKTVSRAVTNVGSDQDSVYKVAVDAPRGLNVKV